MSKRVIWIILDSVGIGALEDAKLFGDEGADTLGHIYESMKKTGFSLPNLERLGLGNIHDIHPAIPSCSNPIGVYCKAREVSRGKDTTIGHWEMCGIETKEAFPTYPNGFPQNLIDEFVTKTKIPGILGNQAASGTEIIEKLGKAHMQTGKPIVYTSADSVFQIACHEEIFCLEQLYEMCMVARQILTGKNAVARVIARPFAGKPGAFYRTAARRDFSLQPNRNNLLCILNDKGIDVHAVGKIEDIFAGIGITNAVHTTDNMDGVDKTLAFMEQYPEGLIFTNLVEYDSKWGHRRDVKNYAAGLQAFDRRLPEIMEKMTEDDLLVINADHGCDPTFPGTDHTREFIPVLIYGKTIKPQNGHVRETFADVGATIATYFGIKIHMGQSILSFSK